MTDRGAPLFPFPLAAYFVILIISIIHLYIAYVIISTNCADLNIPIHALLSWVPARYALAAWIITAAGSSIVALWKDNLPVWATSLMVVPQGLVVLITAGGAYAAFWNAHYVNFDPGCKEFIGTDQLLRASEPFLYGAAVWSIIRESAFNTKIKSMYAALKPQ